MSHNEYEGHLDRIENGLIFGWAWRQNIQHEPISVDLYVDGTQENKTEAALYRADLEIAGKGNGRHAFQIRVPSKLYDGKNHTIRLCYERTTRDLPGSPRSVCLRPEGPPNDSSVTQLLVLDAGLSLNDFNHHRFLCSEILTASREMGIHCTILASAHNHSPDFREADVVPFFDADTYYFFDDLNDYRTRSHQILAVAAQDYARLEIAPGTCILLHSASPWHLEALANALRCARDVRVAIGLIFPSSFWTKDKALQQLLDEMSWRAIDSMSHSKLFLFSETGFSLRNGRPVALPTCVSMMSDATLSLCHDLAGAHSAIPDHIVTFGFFGGLFEHKGVARILDAARNASLDGRYTRIAFFVPPEFHNRAADILGSSDSIVFAAAPMDNKEYLRQMSSVTAILCCYDAAFYTNQMSGIVTEAAALGQPVIVSTGTSLHRFLLQYAPAAAVPVDSDPACLSEVLTRPIAYWDERKKRSAASIRLVRELKSFRRFFRMAFGASDGIRSLIERAPIAMAHEKGT
jgi:hypothetical protein